MAWTTATLVELERREGELRLVIDYGRDDSPETAREHLVVQRAVNIKAAARARLAQLNEVITVRNALALGPIDVSDPPPPPPPPPPDPKPPEVVAEENHIAALARWKRLHQNYVATGLLAINDVRLKPYLDAARDSLLPLYLSRF